MDGKNKGELIEGDGSAWDTCCSQKLRDLIENPVLAYIARVFSQRCMLPESWAQAHQAVNSKKSFKLSWGNKLKAHVFKIFALIDR